LKGLPITLAILDRHVEKQHLSGRLGNITQIGVVDISVEAKSKYSGMYFKIRGLPKIE